MLCLLVSKRFQVLFHSPPGVLFTFPSRYYTLSVTWSYLAFGDGPPFFRQDFSCPDVLWIPLPSKLFRLRDFYSLLWCFPTLFVYNFFLDVRVLTPNILLYSVWAPPLSLATTRGIVIYFLFLRVIRCFSSPGSPHYTMDSCNDNVTLLTLCSHIRISTDHGLFATPRSFSQLVTSFFGAMYQGILRSLFVAYSFKSFSLFLQKKFCTYV